MIEQQGHAILPDADSVADFAALERQARLILPRDTEWSLIGIEEHAFPNLYVYFVVFHAQSIQLSGNVLDIKNKVLCICIAWDEELQEYLVTQPLRKEVYETQTQ